jgi:hypothetical protein
MKSARLAAGATVLLVTVIAAGLIRLRQPKPVQLIPSLTQKPEYCLTCHAELPEISAAHPVKVFGCVSCHGGERLALDETLAHSTMRGGANPSDFIQRATTSVQSTYAGAIASILYTFGQQPDLTARYGTAAVVDDVVTTSTGVAKLLAFDAAEFQNPFIQQFSSNCLTCHINAAPMDGAEYARYTGCAACHTPLERQGEAAAETHQLTTAIPYTQCNSCHNRGNYDLRGMSFARRTDHPTDRLHDYYQPIALFVKCEYTLDCIDCHTRTEAMGDGDLHSNKKEIQYVQCRTCHGTPTELPDTRTLTDPNDIAFRLAQLNPVVELKPGDRVIVTDQGEALWNTRVLPDGSYELVGKATGEQFKFRPVMGSGCTQNTDQQASQYCHECHSVAR